MEDINLNKYGRKNPIKEFNLETDNVFISK